MTTANIAARESSPKVTASHLDRKAYLYIRQSTPQQVLENTESTQRQYALRWRAVALGWPEARVVVIDSDQGMSGASAADREGFQRLVADVSMEQVGIVMGLEVSRLARNSTDWHRLLEICAFTRTLILDEDGIYEPTDFNDRLLLGLKGTMSEVELHVIHARLRGGILSKARRGELACMLPVGFVYDEHDQVRIHPDGQVRDTIRVFFDRELKVDYVCRDYDPSRPRIVCQSMVGTGIDEAVGDLVVETVTPLTLEVSLAVQDELVARAEEVERLRRRQVERFEYEAEEAYERRRQADRLILDQSQRSEVMALATDFPRLWNDPATPMRERKRMLRLLIEDVTLLKKDKQITIHIRFKGGDTQRTKRQIAFRQPL